MFTDDCLVFCRASKQEARNIRYILERCYKVWGQVTNNHNLKSSSLKELIAPKKKIANILQTTLTTSIGAYSCCSNIDKRRSRTDFTENTSQNKKLVGLKECILAKISLVILIKLTLQVSRSFIQINETTKI